jgi:hypothetical protein
VDFGLARRAQQGGIKQVWGTPFYIAPEKARKEQEDHRADIYSLGATLFHVLAGQPPFDAPTAQDVVIKRLKEPAPRLDTLRPDLHPGMVKVIARMLEADPLRRYPTHLSLVADMEKALEEIKANPVQAQKSPKPKPGKKVGIWGAGLVALIGIVGLGAFFLNQKEPAKKAPEGTYVTRLIAGKPVRVKIAEPPPKSPTAAEPKTEEKSTAKPEEASGVFVARFNGKLENEKILQQKDGTILLKAGTAEISGGSLRHEAGKGKDNLGHWASAGEYASWDIDVSRPGSFDLELTYSAMDKAGFKFSIKDQKAEGNLKPTGNWTEFKSLDAGMLKISRAGKYTLEARRKGGRGYHQWNLKSILMSPR